MPAPDARANPVAKRRARHDGPRFAKWFSSVRSRRGYSIRMTARTVNDAMSAIAAAPSEVAKKGWLDVSRGRAFFTHLCGSATIVGAVCALIFFIWYPHPYFQAAGAWNVLRVLIGVDLVVGPLLTLIVFKPGKWGLKFDLCAIATLQLAALIYGISVIYTERPYFTVFALDRFYVLPRKDVDQEQLVDRALVAAERIGSKPVRGPLLVVAMRPTDAAGMQRLLEETLFGGKPDIQQRPEFWTAYGKAAGDVVARAHPLAALRAERPDSAAAIDGLVAKLRMPETELGFLPVVARNKDLAMIVDTASGVPLEVLEVDPWLSGAGPEG